MTGTVEAWDRLHTQRRHLLNYPNEDVVRFLAAMSAKRETGKGLDVGCGAGRHMFLLKQFGFEPYGVDSSLAAIDQASKYGRVELADMTDMPFAEGMFDVVVCCGAAYYGTQQNLFDTIQEIHRVLRSGGWTFLTLRTYRDWRRQAGRLVEPNTVVLDIPDEPEHGMMVSFVGEDELMRLEGWSDMTLELTERTTQRFQRLASDFLLVLQK